MHLDVFAEIYGALKRVGAVETLSGSGERFTYDDEWIESGMPGLSLSLPVSERSFSARRMRPYFEGLLPEGDARANVRQQLGVRSSSYLKLLEAIGGECIGAISVSSKEEGGSCAASYVPLSNDDLLKLASGKERFAEGMAASSRLSLAGAQSKTGLYHFNGNKGEWFKPIGSAASTHIVKPRSNRFESLSENELFCLRLAKSCGMNVPDAFLRSVEGSEHPLFFVARYDRFVSEEAGAVCGMPVPWRLHQEDFCQALGVLPSQKYEKPGQRYAARMADMLRTQSADAVADLNALWDRIAFNYFVGNCDAHLKNYSLLRNINWLESRLAPVYDIVSTAVYSDLDRTMGFSIGTASKLEAVERASFSELAKEMGLSPKRMLTRLDNLRERLYVVIIEADNSESVIRGICDETLRRVERIR